MWVFDTAKAAEEAEVAARAALDIDRDMDGKPAKVQVTTRFADIIETEDGKFALPEHKDMARPAAAIRIADSALRSKLIAEAELLAEAAKR